MSFSYTQTTFSTSSFSTNEEGQQTSSFWVGGYGTETKDGHTKYLLSHPDTSEFVEVSKEEFEKMKNKVQEYLKPSVTAPSVTAPTSQVAPKHLCVGCRNPTWGLGGSYCLSCAMKHGEPI